MADTFNVGDIVKISSDATYYTGRQISPLIKSKTWVVASISNDRILLGKSEDGYYTLNAPVSAKFLTKASD
jgi:hypothetical protein